MIMKKSNLSQRLPKWRFFSALGPALFLAACLPQSDESILRREFEVPAAAATIHIESFGDDIMHRPKTLHKTLDSDLNDFMLAVLDAEKKQLAIKVSTSY